MEMIQVSREMILNANTVVEEIVALNVEMVVTITLQFGILDCKFTWHKSKS